MILYNGKIETMDDASFESRVGTIVQAMAIRDGKILATGTNEEIQSRPLPHKILFFLTQGMNRYNDRDRKVYGPGERTDGVIQLKALTCWGAYYMLRENVMGTLACIIHERTVADQ